MSVPPWSIPFGTGGSKPSARTEVAVSSASCSCRHCAKEREADDAGSWAWVAPAGAAVGKLAGVFIR